MGTYYPLAGELWQARATGVKVRVRCVSNYCVTLYGFESQREFQLPIEWFRKKFVPAAQRN